MKLSENRPVACAVLALVIAGMLFIGGGNALNGWRGQLNDLFYASSESIAAELNEMIDNAVVMNSIAANCEQADRDMVAAVNDSIEQLRASASISEKYAASERLHQAVENLYSNVSNLTLSDTDASDFRYKYKNFDSALLRISHDPYNENVMAFNKAKKGFPAGVICAVRGIDDADLFG